MEPVTQALLGAATAELVAGKTLRGRALGWGALVGMSPDLDVLLGPLHDGYGGWLYHRGTTHSLWFGFVAGPLLGYLLWRWRDFGREDTLAAWIRVGIFALLTHPLLDGFTPYGTQFFAPFDRTRVAWNGVAIVDPFYSAMLGAGVLFAARRSLAETTRRRALQLGVALSTAYLALGLVVNDRVVRDLRARLEPRYGPIERVRAYPTFLQPWTRGFVARAEDVVVVGLHSWQEWSCPAWRVHARPAPSRALDAVDTAWQTRIMRWHADEDVVTFVHQEPGDVLRVRLEDVRYSWTSPEARGAWGIEARVTEAGELLGDPVRFPRRAPTSTEAFRRVGAALLGRLPTRASGWERPADCDPDAPSTARRS
ncbi:MAG: metal-dependent hydrolase [Myxococcota bacterium]